MTKSKKHNSNKKISNKNEKVDNSKTKTKLDETKNKKPEIKQKKANKKIVKNKETKTTMTKNDSEIVKLIKIVLVITVIMVIFYGITMLVTKNRDLSTYENDGSSEKAIIQYEEIMIGTILDKKENEYYVLIKEEDDKRMTEYNTLIQLATAKESTPRFYTANLIDIFNKDYLAKEANITNNINEFKVSGTTLVKVSEGEIADTYSNYDEIKNELKSLVD